MSIFKKIKQGLGFGTAKVELDAPSQISKGTKEVDVTVTLTAQSDQKVKSVKVALVEKVVMNRDGQSHDQRTDIQSVYLKEPFELKKDEIRKLPFKLPVELGGKVSVGLFGGTLEISASSGGNKTYEIMATADLEGVAIDPTAGKYVTFTNN